MFRTCFAVTTNNLYFKYATQQYMKSASTSHVGFYPADWGRSENTLNYFEEPFQTKQKQFHLTQILHLNKIQITI